MQAVRARRDRNVSAEVDMAARRNRYVRHENEAVVDVADERRMRAGGEPGAAFPGQRNQEARARMVGIDARDEFLRPPVPGHRRAVVDGVDSGVDLAEDELEPAIPERVLVLSRDHDIRAAPPGVGPAGRG